MTPIEGSLLSEITLPKPDVEHPLESEWRDDSRYKTMASGAIKKPGIKRYRGYFRFGYRGLDSDTLGLVNQMIGEDEFYFTPRTRLDGVDSAGAVEWNWRVRCRSPLTFHRRLIRSVHPAVYEFETIDLYPGTGIIPVVPELAEWCPNTLHLISYWGVLGPPLFLGSTPGWVQLQSFAPSASMEQIEVVYGDEVLLTWSADDPPGYIDGENWFFWDPDPETGFTVVFNHTPKGAPLAPEYRIVVWCPGQGEPPPS